MKIKKFLIGAIVFATAAIACALTAGAEKYGDYEYQDVTYDTVMITGYTGKASKITVPSSINGSKVTVIGEDAFKGNNTLKQIVLPDTLIYITDSAFQNCSLLTDINIPDGVIKIGEYAFENTPVITNQKTNGKYIDKWLISFSGTDFTVKDGTIGIADSAVEYTNVKTADIPNGVKYVGSFAFYGCGSLENVTFPDTVISVGESVVNQTPLKEKMANASDTYYIGKWLIGCERSLTDLNVKAGTIGIADFAAETDVEKVTLPSSLRYIGMGSFIETSIKTVTIPAGVTSIGMVAFGDCPELTSITVASGNKYYSSVDGALYNKDKSILIQYPAAKTDKTFAVPSTVKVIDYNAFALNQNLTSVKLPSSVVDIRKAAFVEVSSLTSITVPSGVRHIGSLAFWRCFNLNNVELNEGLCSIGEEAFLYCPELHKITVPSSVKRLAEKSLGYTQDKKYNEILDDSFVIYGYGGEAKRYADENNIKYVAKTSVTAVSGFKCQSKTSTSVTLQWTKNSAASGYEIEQYKSGKWTNVAKITSNATTSYTVKGLVAGTAGYKFRMRAVNNGVYSVYTSELTLNTNPYGVGGFKCSSKTSTSVTLQWNKGTTASGYQLQQYKNGNWVTIYTGTKATDTSYTVKNLTAGTAGYRFRIRAYKTYGSTKQYGSWSKEVKVNTNPYGVGGFKCSSKTSTSVTLQWNKGTTASGYELQQYKNGNWVTIYTGTKATDTSYTVKNLTAGTAGYRFRIRAYKTYGSDKQYGSWSNEIKVNTNPYGVGGFKCSSKTSTSVTLQWNKGTTASGYQLQQYKNGNWVTIYTGTKATDTSYTVKNLTAGTAGYRFRIRAYKTYGSDKQYGSWSSEVKVNTNPYGVGGFKVNSTTKTSITLGWNKGTTASGYELQQYKDGKWVTVYTGAKATSTSYTVKSLKANTSYKFRIRAYKTYGSTKQYGSWSNTLTVSTKK